MNEDERLTVRLPNGWKAKLQKIAKAQYLPDKSSLIRKDMAEKYPELRKK